MLALPWNIVPLAWTVEGWGCGVRALAADQPIIWPNAGSSHLAVLADCAVVGVAARSGAVLVKMAVLAEGHPLAFLEGPAFLTFGLASLSLAFERRVCCPSCWNLGGGRLCFFHFAFGAAGAGRCTPPAARRVAPS